MNKLQRFALLNKVLLISIGLIIFYGWFDSLQIQSWYEINRLHPQTDNWLVYGQFTLPALVTLWIGVLLVIAFIYYLVTKDKSESLGLFVAPLIMLLTGLEDVAFFLFSKVNMTACMSWFDTNQFIKFSSKYLLNLDCVSPIGLVLNAGLGIILAYFVLKWLKRQPW